MHQTFASANLLSCFVLFVRVVASIPEYGPQQAAIRSRPSGQMGVTHLLRRWAKIWGGGEISALGVSSKWVKSKTRKRERERLTVGNNNGQLHIANTTSGGAWSKRKKEISENNGQHRIHGSRLDKKRKVSVNNGQLRLTLAIAPRGGAWMIKATWTNIQTMFKASRV